MFQPFRRYTVLKINMIVSIVLVVGAVVAIRLGTWSYFSPFTQACAAWATGSTVSALVIPWAKRKNTEVMQG